MSLESALRHLRDGRWQLAHAIVQEDESMLGCWAHGIVHMLEGDFANARYWYRRIDRPYPGDDAVGAELDALAHAVTDNGTTGGGR